ncbi:subtilase family protein [Striga asiatica]|uniref:Subtilase family protein n=1 Tax=Striga asiatica TaxID=4170 RepID=A0A5A7QW08_STRAF|nr:subtilase family protein [Striga asiatica]
MGKEIILKVAVMGITIFVLSILHVTMAVKKTYIVQMAGDERPEFFPDHFTWYASSLASVSESAKTRYIYENVFDGFSTMLTSEEADLMKGLEGVISVIPETIYTVQTTRTPLFLGLEESSPLLPDPQQVSEVIVGVVDTGVRPEHPSFRDEGLRPVSTSWRGGCEETIDFPKSSCNNKLIGARLFAKAYLDYLNQTGEKVPDDDPISPLDYYGHGTHTASTAAGSPVRGANLFGFAGGTARGMAPTARVASYKACWDYGCFGADVLAAIERAIYDGVHVLSMSVGDDGGLDYDKNLVAIGAFAATSRGIFVSCSAGNEGPDPSSLILFAPWVVTVGAGTIDRDFPADVMLGDKTNCTGISLYSRRKPLSGGLVYAANVSNNGSSFCTNGTLAMEKVKNKIVLCDGGVNTRIHKAEVVKEAGGLGMIVADDYTSPDSCMVADAYMSPGTRVGKKAGREIKRYLQSHRSNAKASIMFSGKDTVGVKPSPMVPAFSSRGPNPITPEILKPDLIAPGVNILAGWGPALGPSLVGIDKRKVQFNIITGTSMSCPHVSGLAALLKAAHPDWSPAAIRSALMTTAYSTYEDGSPLLDGATGNASNPFAHGSGHVSPVTALNPGLVYNLTKIDYLNFLCAIKYNSSQIKVFAGKTKFRCEQRKLYNVYDLNYPSFAATIPPSGKCKTKVVFRRTLTNVGENGTTYRVSISSPTPSATISVTPKTLVFHQKNEAKSYKLTVVAAYMPPGTNAFGRIEWSDGNNVVGSPVAVSWINATRE